MSESTAHATFHYDSDRSDDEIDATTIPISKKSKVDVVESFENPTKACTARVHSDLTKLYREPLDGIFVVLDENRVNRCHAIVIGPLETPYEHGFFYFIMDFPNHYPHEPPKVVLQTTGGGSVRFNPNLYKNGKVCLSILGTWSGPSWSPVQGIGSVLLSIQSLLNSHPYHNEPGFETLNRFGREPKNYNHIIRHETIRVAVLDMVDRARLGTKHDKMPEKLRELIREVFLITCELCQQICEDYSFLDGKAFQDPYHNNYGTFQFASLQRRLTKMREEEEKAQIQLQAAGGDKKATTTE